MLISVAIASAAIFLAPQAQSKLTSEPSPGQLTVALKDGKFGALCPLEKTNASAEIDGFGATVTVKQTFKNTSPDTIEAVYTFPLPNDAAVDQMNMKVGDRLIEGTIKRREEARLIYESAKSQGMAAALLDQERPNIFTQSVANILPGSTVEITIRYVQILKYEAGQFEFNFPMVVGPRNLSQATDPGKISPPIVPKGTRSGANIELSVKLQAGAPITSINSVQHEVRRRTTGSSSQTITLAKKDEIPNRDFILRWSCAKSSVQTSLLSHMDEARGGYFSLILLPPKSPTANQIRPREVFFVMDQSGSQCGFPIEKSKELTQKLISTLRNSDTFNVFGFNTEIRSLFPAAVAPSKTNIAAAEAYVKAMSANGGTNILEGLRAALANQDQRRLRIVLLNTDGYVGNESEILDLVQKNRDRARVFTFGIGSSTNRYLIDSIAAEGRGAAEYVTLAESADAALAKFINRLDAPVLTDVTATFEGDVQVTELLPGAIPDVFSDQPIVLYGRFDKPGKATLRLTGLLGEKPWSQNLEVQFPAFAEAPSLPALWARKKIDDLTRKNYMGRRAANPQLDFQSEITQIALDYGIMSDFTSLVAVEKRVINVGGKQRTIAVPVEMPQGVSYGSGLADLETRSRSKGGGFGGGSFARAAGAPVSLGVPASTSAGGSRGAPAKAESNPLAFAFVIYNPTTGTLVVDEKPKPNKGALGTKLDPKLIGVKGPLEVEIMFSKLDSKTLDTIKKLGAKVLFSDEGLKFAMVSTDVKQLIELIKIDVVQHIRPVSK